MGPDEFHEGYPDAPTPGLNNNAYTNIMAVWVLCRALDVLDLLPDIRRAELMTRLGLSADEIARWGDISRRMFVPFHGDGMALHQKSLLYRIFRSKNRSLWSRKSLQNETKKVLLTDGSAY